MKKINKYIEIVVSDVDGLTLMPKDAQGMVYEVLQDNYTKVSISTIHKKTDLENLVKKSPDLVFSGIKYVKFENDNIANDSTDMIWLSEYLDVRGIAYTGSGKEALKLEFDKSKAKQKVQEADVNTSPFFVTKPNQFTKSRDLPVSFPLFVKPLYEGDGRGIDFDSIIYDFESYEKKVKDIFQRFKTPALVEKYLSGREFTVGIIGSDYNDLIVMPIEIIAVPNDAGERVRGSQVKEADTEKSVYIQDDDVRKNVSTLAQSAFKALGARDYGRIDIRMDEKGIPYFLEANLIPGLHKSYGDLPRSCRINNKMSYEELILKIAELGLLRTLSKK